MTLGSATVSAGSPAGCYCVCCGAKMTPYFSKNAVVSQEKINRLISESFLTVKGAALFLPRSNGPSPSSAPRTTHRLNKHAGDLQQHLQTMLPLLRLEDNIRLAVRLESAHSHCTRYMVVVCTSGRQDTEESVVLGIDFASSDSVCSVGLVLPLWSDTQIHLGGDGGFSVSTANRVHVFKPVSVQAMWSALQSLHKACEVARCHNYYPGSLFLTWVSYYQSQVASDQACINEWNAMQDVQSHRADSPVLFNDEPTERECTERLIKARLREIMMQMDLENVTSKEIRTELEMQMVCNLRDFKEFIDNEMIVILGQMDSPTEIFEHVLLGSEWNASNLEELQSSGIRFILNVTREIDNFFPGLFEYHNIRVYDEEATDLLAYWNDTYKFISKAKKAGAKCLVHCKMGVSRSASTVIAYAMKEYGWDLEHAFDHVKERRTVAKPNPSFMRQLEEYQGILLASKQRHNKLWRSHSDGDLSERRELPSRSPQTLSCSDPHNNSANSRPSLQNFLDTKDAMTAVTDPHGADVAGPAQSPMDPSISALVSRPQVATVVPDERLDCATVTVAETFLVGRPHPPPSLHLLHPSSPPLSTDTGLHQTDLPAVNEGPSELSKAVPEEKHTAHSAQCSLEDMCQSAGPHRMLAAGHDAGDCAQISLDTCVANGPLLHTPTTDDMNNANDRDPCGVTAPSDKMTVSQCPTSPLGTDSIDFFSAREKFECGSYSLSEQAASSAPHLKYFVHELQPLTLEDPRDTPASLREESEVCSDGVEQRLQPETEVLIASHNLLLSSPPTVTPQFTACGSRQEMLKQGCPLQDGTASGAEPEGSMLTEGGVAQGAGEAELREERDTRNTTLAFHQCAGDRYSAALAGSCPPAPDSASYTQVLYLEGVTEQDTDTDMDRAELQDTREALRVLRDYLCEEEEEELGCGHRRTRGDAANDVPQASATQTQNSACLLPSSDLASCPSPAGPPLLPEPQPHNMATGAEMHRVSPEGPLCLLPDTIVAPALRSAVEGGACEHGVLLSLQSPLLSPAQHSDSDGPESGTLPLLSMVTRQQYGKTHPVRRLSKPSEKKRTSNFLYNTM